MTSRRGEVAGIVLLLLGAITFVDPRGDMPLNDDWNFALTTWKFAETGHFVYSRFTAMTLKAQVLWGAMWTVVFGESFEVLRLSSLVLLVLSTLLVNHWLARLEVEDWARWLATLAFAFHPIVFWSSFTYMTQIPFLFCALVSLWAFHRGLSNDDARFVALGSLAVVAAFFVRQTGVVLVVAPCVALLRQRSEASPRWRELLALALAPAALFVVLFSLTNVLNGYPGQIHEHFVVWKVPFAQLPIQIAKVVGCYTLFNFQSAALFCLPLVLLLAFWLLGSGLGRVTLSLGVAGFSAGAVAMVLAGFPMPYWSSIPRLEVHPGNVLVNLGLGPMTLRDTWTLDMTPPFPLEYQPRVLLTLACAALGGILAATLVSSWSASPRFPRGARLLIDMSVAHCVAATAALFVSGIYFDRYAVDSLWTVVILAPVLVRDVGTLRKSLAVISLLVLALFSILATQEYLRWNRARWRAFDELRAAGITLDRMDGGYEINQYLVGGFDGPVLLKRSGFSVIDPEYILTFNRVPGYTVVGEQRYASFLGLRHGAVLTLHRVGGSQ